MLTTTLLVFSILATANLGNSHGVLKIPKPREEPGSGDWHYCRFFVNQYYLRSKFMGSNLIFNIRIYS